MRVSKAMFALGFSILLPSLCFADDISDTLQYIQKTFQENMAAGYEDFYDEPPDDRLLDILDRRDSKYRFQPPLQPLVRAELRLSFNELVPILERAYEQTGVPIELLDAVIRTESDYRPNAVSPLGAQGLMQLMPITALEVGVRDAFDPEQNVIGGATYLKQLLERFNTLPLALAAYNAGPANVVKHNGVPPNEETQRYVRTVLNRYVKESGVAATTLGKYGDIYRW